jgi:hypothetical protein
MGRDAMMTKTTAMIVEEAKPVVRPLKVLVPLIKEDLRHGDEAAQQAAMPYYRAAGEKMLEAKGQMPHGEFGSWLKLHFSISYQQSARYMKFAAATAGKHISRARDFSSLRDFERSEGISTGTGKTTWHEPVREAINRVNVGTFQQAALARAEERELQRKLALQLINIGFKALATKLHPDKGGSREAMARLNEVRNRLQKSA